jgi:hypothetical protein
MTEAQQGEDWLTNCPCLLTTAARDPEYRGAL